MPFIPNDTRHFDKSAPYSPVLIWARNSVRFLRASLIALSKLSVQNSGGTFYKQNLLLKNIEI